MALDGTFFFMKECAQRLGQGIEALCEGTGRPQYNDLKAGLQYLDRARAGFLLYLSELKVLTQTGTNATVSKIESKQITEIDTARKIVTACMNQIPEWAKEKLYEQYRSLTYIMALNQSTTEGCSGGLTYHIIDLTNADPRLKEDYYRLTQFYKNLDKELQKVQLS